MQKKFVGLFFQYFLIIVVVYGKATAQTVHPIEQYFLYKDDNNVYFKDVNNIFTSFIGTWQYSTPDKYFKITLTKQIKVQTPSSVTTLTRYEDKIIGHFQYKEKVNGAWLIRYDTYNLNYLYSFLSTVEDLNTITLFYKEPELTGTCGRNRYGYITLVFSFSSPNNPQLQWNRENGPIGADLDEPCPDGTPRDTSEFIIPANMTLTKIN